MTVLDLEQTTSSCFSAESASFELLGRLRLARRLDNRAKAPELGAEALHGLAGDIVSSLEPLTEASVPAMLTTLLVSFSAMVGRTAHANVGSQKHYPVLFGLVVGASSRARKGTGVAAVRPVLSAADPEFMDQRRVSGVIQSGEALIQTAVAMGQSTVGGYPHKDQRVLTVEEEFARLLTVAARQGATLSPVMRSAWDSDVLGTRTKAQTLTASDAHVCFLGQITMAELTQDLKPVDIQNGFGNRFLFVLSHRTNLIPEPGRIPEDDVQRFGQHLRSAVRFAHGCGEMKRSEGFRVAWQDLYCLIESQPSGGRFYDALTGRATAHLLRLAMIYALLDESPIMKEVHLRAAAALWDYAEASVAHIWGATLGDADLDRLYVAVKGAGEDGLTRTQISELFSKNKRRAELETLVTQLVDLGLVTNTSQPSTGGRPSQIVRAAA